MAWACRVLKLCVGLQYFSGTFAIEPEAFHFVKRLLSKQDVSSSEATRGVRIFRGHEGSVRLREARYHSKSMFDKYKALSY